MFKNQGRYKSSYNKAAKKCKKSRSFSIKPGSKNGTRI